MYDLHQFELRLPVDVFKIDMTWPERSDMVVLGQFNGLTNVFDRFDKRLRLFADLHLCSLQVLDAVAVDLG